MRIGGAHPGEEGAGGPGVEERRGEGVDRGGDRPVVVGAEGQGLRGGSDLAGEAAREEAGGEEEPAQPLSPLGVSPLGAWAALARESARVASSFLPRLARARA